MCVSIPYRGVTGKNVRRAQWRGNRGKLIKQWRPKHSSSICLDGQKKWQKYCYKTILTGNMTAMAHKNTSTYLWKWLRLVLETLRHSYISKQHCYICGTFSGIFFLFCASCSQLLFFLRSRLRMLWQRGNGISEMEKLGCNALGVVSHYFLGSGAS